MLTKFIWQRLSLSSKHYLHPARRYLSSAHDGTRILRAKGLARNKVCKLFSHESTGSSVSRARHSCNRLWQLPHQQRAFTTMIDVESWIHEHTEVTSHHLTPEIEVHLITESCALWYARPEDCPFNDPFWAFYWPGGQALTRYILDHQSMFKDQVILDVGSGCGASAIACAKAGAKRIVANDIDPVALSAIQMNAHLNGVAVETTWDNMIGVCSSPWDFVLLGDMFYDAEFSMKVFDWIKQLSKRGSRVLVGDPGRIFFETLPSSHLKLLEKYTLTSNCKKENYGLTHGNVWEFVESVNRPGSDVEM